MAPPFRPIASISRVICRSVVILSLVATAGCDANSREYRVEQVLHVGDEIKVVMGSGVTVQSKWTSLRTFEQRQYTMLSFKLADRTCPAITAYEVLDLSVGMPAVNFSDNTPYYEEPPEDTAGPRVDFLMNPESNRVTRVLSRVRRGRLEQQIAVLGSDSQTGKWGVLRAWVREEPFSAGTYGSTLDGRYVFLRDPSRVIDTRTLEELSGDTISQIHPQPYAATLKWDDWKARTDEAKHGAVGYAGPICYGQSLDAFYVWDVDSHKEGLWPGGAPPCRGLCISIAGVGAAARLFVLDVDGPMRSQGYDRAVDKIFGNN